MGSGPSGFQPEGPSTFRSDRERRSTVMKSEATVRRMVERSDVEGYRRSATVGEPPVGPGELAAPRTGRAQFVDGVPLLDERHDETRERAVLGVRRFQRKRDAGTESGEASRRHGADLGFAGGVGRCVDLEGAGGTVRQREHLPLSAASQPAPRQQDAGTIMVDRHHARAARTRVLSSSVRSFTRSPPR